MQIRRRALDAWLTDLRAGWGERAYGAAAGVSHLLPSCDTAGLQLIGQKLAQSGFTLDEVLAWFHLLARRSRVARTMLHDGGLAALAAGWADGVMSAEYGAERIAPLELLRLRLHQQSALAASIGQHTGHLALVVIEVVHGAHLSDVVLLTARGEFTGGESIAVAPNGKVLILVRRHHDLRLRTLHLTNSLRANPGLRGSTVRVWIEPLGMSAEHVDSHLLSLAS
ncbi:MAG TPA: hypothetical protein DCR14_16975 [Acidimicrobiaceae bacterium]|nr:hypothetical protein [Acidimicrobiaceae bacterium]